MDAMLVGIGGAGTFVASALLWQSIVRPDLVAATLGWPGPARGWLTALLGAAAFLASFNLGLVASFIAMTSL